VPAATGSNTFPVTPFPDQTPPTGENGTNINVPVPSQTKVSFPALAFGIAKTKTVLVSVF
jgi:hypothetical protein